MNPAPQLSGEYIENTFRVKITSAVQSTIEPVRHLFKNLLPHNN